MKNTPSKSKSAKKLLALALSSLLILGAVPFMAFAAEPDSSSESSSSSSSQNSSSSEQTAPASSSSEQTPASSSQSSSSSASGEEAQSGSAAASSEAPETTPEPPQAPQATQELQPASGGQPQILVHAYLVNTAGQPIDANGQPVAPENKHVFATYEPRTEDALAFDTSIQYYAQDVVTGSNNLDYQFAGAVNGSDDPAVPVTLTEAEPVKDIYLAYTAKRTLTLYKKNTVGDLTWKTFKTTTEVSVGSQVSIESFYSSPANPIDLAANVELLGWSLNSTAASTDYPAFQPTQGTPDFVMGDGNISLYSVLKSNVPTGKIKVNKYLVNSKGVPIDRAGNPLPTDDKTTWVLLDSYFYSLNGSTDIPIGASYTPFANQNEITLTESGKQNKYTFFKDLSGIDYLDPSYETYWLNTAGQVAETTYGYMQLFADTFHTNFPADSKASGGAPMTERSWVQSYNENNNVQLNYADISYGSTTAFYNLKNTMPANYTFYGWADQPNPALTTAQDLIDIQNNQKFYPFSTRTFPQPAHDMDLYAVWGPSNLGSVKINQGQVVTYLVNYKGEAIDWNGNVKPFDPQTIEKLNRKYDLSFYNYSTFVPGVYYDLYPVSNITVLRDLGGKPVERYFYNVAGASKYGATTQPIRITVDASGNILDKDGNPVTLYYGYEMKYEVIINSNYPADTGNTDTYSRTTYDRVWSHDPTYSFYKELLPKGYTFLGFNYKEKNASGTMVEKFLPAYPTNLRYSFQEPKYSDIELTALWVPNSQVANFTIHSYWIDYYGKPLDANGYVISNAEFAEKGYIINTTPLFTSPFPYEAGGTSYSFSTSGFYSLPTYSFNSEGRQFKLNSSIPAYKKDLTTNTLSNFTVDSSDPIEYFKGYTSENTVSVNLNPPKELGITTQTKELSSKYAVNQPIFENVLKTAVTFETFDGYSFVGWSYEEDGLDSIIPLNTMYSSKYLPMPAKDITLYAQWKKDIVNDTENGNITIVGYATNAEGKPIDAEGKVVANPTLAYQIRLLPYQNDGSTSLKLGFDYRPAALNFTLGNSRYIYNQNAQNFGGSASMQPIPLTLANKNVSVYFGYTFTVSYIVQYNSNFPADATAEQQAQIGQPVYTNNRFAEGEIIKGELASYDNSTLPEDFPYMFAGWTESSTPSDTDTVYSTTGTGFTMPGHDAELYAKWTPLYTVEYHAGEHGTIENPNAGDLMRHSKIASGSPLPAAPSLNAETGWEFDGWDNNYSSSMLVTGNLTFTALWKKIPASSSSIVTSSSKPAPSSSIASSSFAPASSSNVMPVAISSAPVSSKAPASSTAPVSSKAVSSSKAPASSKAASSSSTSAAPSSTSPVPSSTAPSSTAPTSRAASSSSTSAPVSTTVVSSTGSTSAAPASKAPESKIIGNVSDDSSDAQQNQETQNNVEDSSIPNLQLGKNQVPLFSIGSVATWSLLSLILAVASIISAAIILVRLLAGRSVKNSPAAKVMKIVSMLLGVLSPIMFLLVYNLNSLMVVMDAWTILFVVILAAELIIAFMAKRRSEMDNSTSSQNI